MNAEKIGVTGKKLDDKMYYRHSGYPGGLKSRPLREELGAGRQRSFATRSRACCPRNRLGRAQIRKLKIYAGPEHPHAAQAPEPLEVRS